MAAFVRLRMMAWRRITARHQPGDAGGFMRGSPGERLQGERTREAACPQVAATALPPGPPVCSVTFPRSRYEAGSLLPPCTWAGPVARFVWRNAGRAMLCSSLPRLDVERVAASAFVPWKAPTRNAAVTCEETKLTSGRTGTLAVPVADFRLAASIDGQPCGFWTSKPSQHPSCHPHGAEEPTR